MMHTSLSSSAQTAAYIHQGEGGEGYRDDACIALDIDTDTHIYRYIYR